MGSSVMRHVTDMLGRYRENRNISYTHPRERQSRDPPIMITPNQGRRSTYVLVQDTMQRAGFLLNMRSGDDRVISPKRQEQDEGDDSISSAVEGTLECPSNNLITPCQDYT